MTRFDKIDQIKKGKPVRAPDAVFLVLLSAVLGAVFYFTLRPSGSSDKLYLEVRVNGGFYGSYALDKDGSYDIDRKMTLTVENKSAFVTDSVCPDHICEKSRIRRVHEMIVCLPEGITIRIVGRAFLLPGAR
jgi:hypothetical protein